MHIDKEMVHSIEREREEAGVQWPPTYICPGEHYLFTASIFSNVVNNTLVHLLKHVRRWSCSLGSDEGGQSHCPNTSIIKRQISKDETADCSGYVTAATHENGSEASAILQEFPAG